MKDEKGAIEKMHEDLGRQKISQIERKLRATQDNIEISDEIIAGTPSDAQRDKLIEKNVQRKRAVGAMRKELRDVEQRMEERGKELST